MDKTIDMSPEAVTNRMEALDSLWEFSVALKSSRIVEECAEELADDELSYEIKNYED